MDKMIKFKMSVCFIFFIMPGFLVSCSPQPSDTTKKFSEPMIMWPSPPEPPRIKYLMSIERPKDLGIGNSFFNSLKRLFLGRSQERIVKPYGVVSDEDGRIIVADPGIHMVHLFYPQKNRYIRIPKDFSERIESPIGVASDGVNRIYVTDSMSKVLKVYDMKGVLLSKIDKVFQRPTGIAVDSQTGRIYVVDTLLHKVFIFDRNGKQLGSFGKRGSNDGEFNYPTNIFINKDGLVYVSDSMNFRVQVFDRDGRFITRFGHHGDGSGDFSSLKGIAVDSEGNIYVVDALFDAVQIFDKNGRFLLSFGSSGKGPGQFWLPTGIFIDNKDRIYVADSYNSRVQVFQFLGSTEGPPIIEKKDKEE